MPEIPDGIPIILLTGRFVVVDKPAGLLSVPGKGEANQDCVARRVARAFPQATGPLIVHRLDMATSGLLVLALDPDAHRSLSMAFERRAVSKRYEALLAGDLSTLGSGGNIDLPIRTDITRRPLQIVDDVHGKPSQTRWRLMGVEHGPTGPRSRVEFEPITGRTHQLRLHSATPQPRGLGCPILGDDLYGGEPAARLMLHASELRFPHPDGGGNVVARSPTPF